MLQSKEPVIIITKAELDYIIKQAATMAAMEVAKNLSANSKKIRPADVNQTVAAKMLNISRPKIKRMLNAGILRLNKFGRIPIEQIDAALMPSY